MKNETTAKTDAKVNWNSSLENDNGLTLYIGSNDQKIWWIITFMILDFNGVFVLAKSMSGEICVAYR